MDRCAVFVDVGYLYAAGGTVAVREKTRARLLLDIPGVVGMLAEKATSHCAAALLRTYWYDGAANGIPTAEHRRAGLVDDVKLRLGRLNSRGQQKGVDALIYRDLMTLARERAISNAFLLSGDGDLVEGVRAAQDLGTHVTLLYIEGSGQGASPELLGEVDRRIRLLSGDLAPYLSLVSARLEDNVENAGISGDATDVPANPPAATPVEAAIAYAAQWLGKATESEVRILAQQHPKIPKQLDVEMLKFVEASIGRTLRGDTRSRHAMRSAFWATLRKELDGYDTPQ